MATIGNDIGIAKQLLTAGELVAIPTETVYGLAANAMNGSAITKIFLTKNRPAFDPLIVHVASLEQARSVTREWPSAAEVLAKKFWPGPLTLVLPKIERVPDLVTSGLDTVGVRCPNHPLTLSLLRSLDFPLAAPSANPFGYVSPTTADHVQKQLGDQLPYILDGGPCEVGLESTIVGFEQNKVIVYRLGGLDLETIEDVVGPVSTQTTSSSNPKAPGQLSSHYAPGKQVFMGVLDEVLTTYPPEKVGVLAFSHPVGRVPSLNQIILSPGGRVEEAAQHLFGALRQFDQMDVSVIWAEAVPNQGIGRAINDRLRRASHH